MYPKASLNFCLKMVDYQLFEKILSQDEGYIQNGDFIDNKTFELFSKYPTSKVEKLFIKMPNGLTHFVYKCEIKCDKCGTLLNVDYSKTNVIEYIKHLRNGKPSHCFYCKKCEEELRRKQIEDSRKGALIIEEQIRKNTDNYIDKYLNPDYSWKDNVKTSHKITELSNSYVDWGEIREYIKDMDYYNFLKTPYWKAIAEKVKYKANYRCQICNSNEKLNVHHRTYDNHGDELHHMDDLICICEDCHEKYHLD